MRDGEDLVLEPFARLISQRQLMAYPYDGFWRNMDTFKDKQTLDALWAQGKAPWRPRVPRLVSGVGAGIEGT
jgi:glucose-1-phosphate cytidylyltransferase